MRNGLLSVMLFLCFTVPAFGASYPEYSVHNVGKPIKTPPDVQPPFTQMVPWVHLVTTNRDIVPDLARITLVSFRIIKEGEADPVYDEDFRTAIPLTGGAMFLRDKNWVEGSKSLILNQTVGASGLTIDLRDLGKWWVHFWTPRLPYARGDKYRFELDVMIEGETWLQIGVDYYRGDQKWATDVPGDAWTTCLNSWQCEGGVSRWYAKPKGAITTLTYMNY